MILGVMLASASAVGIHAFINRDGLEGIEYECRDALLRNDAMIGTTGLRIEKHYNWWEKTYTMSWVLLGAISKPYENPLVEFAIRFKGQGGLPHKAWASCHFAIIPDSGQPPKVRFESIHID
ncbi:MAG TPA: hypothetical protein VLV76_23085 [Candidatus Acidoferrum sp.]|nr:hypothetical protein [Candidatus Acidoferrum sp.]